MGVLEHFLTRRTLPAVKKSLLFYLGVFVLLAFGAGWAGILILDSHKESTKLDKQQELNAIGDLKVRQIANWLKDQRAVAEMEAGDALLAGEIEAWLHRGAPVDGTRRSLLAHLKNLKEAYHYRDVILLDDKGEGRLWADAARKVEPYARRTAAQAMLAKTVTMSDLHWEEEEPPRQIELDLFAPLIANTGGHVHSVGAIYFAIDPREYLYPLVQSWPTPSPSAETILVRREGNDVLHLSEVRRHKNATLRLRVPLSRQNIPSVMAVLGREGVAEAVDLGGIPVLAALRKIPDSPWFMVSKVDAREVYAPIYSMAKMGGGLIAVFLAMGGAVTLLAWRQQHAQFRLRQYQSELSHQFELQRSEARYRQLFESNPAAIWVYDTESLHFLAVNNAAVDQLGYDREEFLAMTVADLRPREDVPVSPAHSESGGARPSQARAARLLAKNGAIVHVETVSHVVAFNGGHARLVIALDVTERVQAEQALQESEHKLHAYLDNAIESAWVVDRDGRLLEANPAACAMLGYTKEELLRLSIPDVLEKAQPYFYQGMQHFRKLIQTERSYCEIALARKDGSRVLADCSAVAIGDNRYLELCRDITEQKQATESLRLWAKVFESSVEGIIITDPRNRIVSVNRAFTKVTGYGAEEVLGRTPGVLSSGHHDREFYRDMHRALREHGAWQGEIWNRRKNGEVYPEWLSITTLKNDGDEITQHIGVFSDITERKAAEKRIEFLAHHDALTGLPNRALLRDRFAQALASASRSGHRVGVFFIDLDRFKNVNDSLGHHVGDLLLKAVSERMRSCVRAEDTVARQGGDEFIVVTSQLARPQDAVRVAKQIMQTLAVPFVIGEHELGTSPSIGISIYPDDGEDVDTLIKNADAAMYYAKGIGRNNYQFYTAELNSQALAALTIENGLRRALEHGEFELHYQPQVDVRSGDIIGMEALLRWRHPEKGMILPGTFIRIAEESGLIVPIGEWVLREACRQNRRWQDAGLLAVPIAVNLSAAQFRKPDLVKIVMGALAESDLEPRFLELEVTESLIMLDVETVLLTLSALKTAGLSLAIDDFGTGYSSLSYIKRFNVDKLKIDQSFIRDLTGDDDDAALVAAIIAMAKSLNLKVIAEGVETEAQLAYLRGKGCDTTQGYLLGKPLPPGELALLLEAAPRQ